MNREGVAPSQPSRCGARREAVSEQAIALDAVAPMRRVQGDVFGDVRATLQFELNDFESTGVRGH